MHSPTLAPDVPGGPSSSPRTEASRAGAAAYPEGMSLLSMRGPAELDHLYDFRAYDYGPFTPRSIATWTNWRKPASRGVGAGSWSWRTYRPTAEGVTRAVALISSVSTTASQTRTRSTIREEVAAFPPTPSRDLCEVPRVRRQHRREGSRAGRVDDPNRRACLQGRGRDGLRQPSDRDAGYERGLCSPPWDREDPPLGPHMLWAAAGHLGIIQDISGDLEAWAKTTP